MFKGTKKHGPNEFSRIVAQNGGRENAFTGTDYTAYFQQLEKSRLKISFELEADRMRNLVLNPQEFAKEIRVVMEERRLRTDDEPHALLYEQFEAAVFVNSPYRHPIIGWMNDLEHMKIEDLQAWYDTWYAPNNATLVVVGDVDPQAVFALAEQYFGPLKPSKITPPKPRQEQRQLGIKRLTVKAPAELPFMIMGWKTPVFKTAADPTEAYAIEMIGGVLDGGNSARFAKHLVRGEQVATSVGTGYHLFSAGETVFMVQATPAEGKSVADVEAAIRAQIKRLQDELVSAEELARIKAQVMAAKVYERDSGFYQAMQLGTLVTVGLDWRLADQYLSNIEAVTPEQIRNAARKYFIDDYLTVAVLDPQPLAADRPASRPTLPPAHTR